MSRIVEFMGLPGCGKSTLAAGLLMDVPALRSDGDALVACYRQRQPGLAGLAVRLLPPALWQHRIAAGESGGALHAFSCAHPEFMALMFDVVAKAKLKADWRSCVLFAMMKRMAEHHLLETDAKTSQDVLVEEGLALGLITVMGALPLGSDCDDAIEAYVAAMPALNGIIYVNVNLDQCADRLLQRPELPLLWAGNSREDLIAQLSFSQSIFDRALTALRARGIPVHAVSNEDGALERVRGEVRDYVKSLSPTKGGGSPS